MLTAPAAIDGTADIASTVLSRKDYADGRGEKHFREKVRRARRRYGSKARLTAAASITLLPVRADVA